MNYLFQRYLMDRVKDPALTIGSAMITEPVAGLMAAGTEMLGGDSLAMLEAVRNHQLYSPQSEQGRKDTEATLNALSTVFSPLEKFNRWLGDKAYDAMPDSAPDELKALAGTLGYIGTDLLLTGLGGPQALKQARNLDNRLSHLRIDSAPMSPTPFSDQRGAIMANPATKRSWQKHKYRKSDGTVIGGPSGFKQKDVQKARKAAFEYLKEGKAWKDWYTRTQDEIAKYSSGDDASRLAYGNLQALTSPSMKLDQNLIHANIGYNQLLAGNELNGGIFPNQMRNAFYRNPGNTGNYGLKVQPYRESIIGPDLFHENAMSRAVHDIWHARALGYGNDWNKGLGAAQHRYLDIEDQNLIKMAEDSGLFGDEKLWPHQVQAMIWGGKKIERENIQPELWGYTYGDFAQNKGNGVVTMNLETVPTGNLSERGHFSNYANMPYPVKQGIHDDLIGSMLNERNQPYIFMDTPHANQNSNAKGGIFYGMDDAYGAWNDPKLGMQHNPTSVLKYGGGSKSADIQGRRWEVGDIHPETGEPIDMAARNKLNSYKAADPATEQVIKTEREILRVMYGQQGLGSSIFDTTGVNKSLTNRTRLSRRLTKDEIDTWAKEANKEFGDDAFISDGPYGTEIGSINNELNDAITTWAANKAKTSDIGVTRGYNSIKDNYSYGDWEKVSTEFNGLMETVEALPMAQRLQKEAGVRRLAHNMLKSWDRMTQLGAGNPEKNMKAAFKALANGGFRLLKEKIASGEVEMLIIAPIVYKYLNGELDANSL